MQTLITPPVTLTEIDLTFEREMLGWPGARNFRIEPIEESNGMFAVLKCLDEVTLHAGAVVRGLNFLVTPPGWLWPEYQIELDEQFAENLGLVVPEEAALLAIVCQREPLERSTVNLFSPIVLNRFTGAADQFVPAMREEESGWSVRTPFPTSPSMDG